MAEFPLEPQLSKMLITAADLACAEEILTIVAMLSVEQPFYRPKEKQAQADAKKAKFFQAEGDHLMLLAIYEAWKNAKFSNPSAAPRGHRPRPEPLLGRRRGDAAAAGPLLGRRRGDAAAAA